MPSYDHLAAQSPTLYRSENIGKTTYSTASAVIRSLVDPVPAQNRKSASIKDRTRLLYIQIEPRNISPLSNRHFSIRICIVRDLPAC